MNKSEFQLWCQFTYFYGNDAWGYIFTQFVKNSSTGWLIQNVSQHSIARNFPPPRTSRWSRGCLARGTWSRSPSGSNSPSSMRLKWKSERSSKNPRIEEWKTHLKKDLNPDSSDVKIVESESNRSTMLIWKYPAAFGVLWSISPTFEAFKGNISASRFGLDFLVHGIQHFWECIKVEWQRIQWHKSCRKHVGGIDTWRPEVAWYCNTTIIYVYGYGCSL